MHLAKGPELCAVAVMACDDETVGDDVDLQEDCGILQACLQQPAALRLESNSVRCCVVMRTRKKPAASKLRTRRVSMIRKRGEVLGDVEAPTREAAEMAAVKTFGLRPEDRNRIVIQERG